MEHFFSEKGTRQLEEKSVSKYRFLYHELKPRGMTSAVLPHEIYSLLNNNYLFGKSGKRRYRQLVLMQSNYGTEKKIILNSDIQIEIILCSPFPRKTSLLNNNGLVNLSCNSSQMILESECRALNLCFFLERFS